MPSVNDAHHAAVLHEASTILSVGGCTLADAGYEHVYTGEFKSLLSKCDSVAAHVIRTRADRLAFINNNLLWYDVKTTSWTNGQDFPIEALPFLKACCDAKTFGINYLFCCRRHDGSDYGLYAGIESARLIQRILVPEWRRGGDIERWKQVFQPMLNVLGCDVPIFSGGCSRGGGDAFVALAIDTVALPTWQQALADWLTHSTTELEVVNRQGCT